MSSCLLKFNLLFLALLFWPGQVFSTPQHYFYQDNQDTSRSIGREAPPRPSVGWHSTFWRENDRPAPLPVSNLERSDAYINSRGQVFLAQLPKFTTEIGGRYAALSRQQHLTLFTVAPTLQRAAENLLAKVQAPHAAAVLMEPTTGRILAIADKSSSLPQAALHATYPAASLFKIVTSAAALELSNLGPHSRIFYRGGTYTLNRSNYQPSQKYDRHVMTLTEALGKSCNPAFARVALQHLNRAVLLDYAEAFGFNQDIEFDIPLRESSARIAADDYNVSRTAAGFGSVHMSPVHAAAFMAAIANGGLLPRPFLVEQVVDQRGRLLQGNSPRYLSRVVRTETAAQVMEMLEYSTTKGTARNFFYPNQNPQLPGVRVASKTGTLRGTNPPGLNRWFIAAAPLKKPEIVVAVVVVNPASQQANASRLGRELLKSYFASPEGIKYAMQR